MYTYSALILNGLNLKSFNNPLLFKYLSFLVFLIALSGCSKEDNGLDVKKAASLFEVNVYDPRYRKLTKSNINLVDSAFHFDNLSTVGENITYKWEFGDGTSSTEKEPIHVYTSYGKYKVKLTTTYRNDQSDTLEMELEVITGQKRISLGTNISTAGIDILETKENNFLLLGSAYDINLSASRSYSFLMNLDNNLRQKTIISYPENVRLSTLLSIPDGGYISCGTTQSDANNNEIIKLSADGKILWSHIVSNGSNFTHVSKTQDNNFILTGTRSVNGRFRAVTLKTDANGIVIWEKIFNDSQILETPFNSIIDGNNYVMAGVIRKDPNICSTCDSISILKLDANGNQILKTKIEMKTPTSLYGLAHITKLNNDGYAVIVNGSRGLYTFSSSLEPNIRTNLFNDGVHIASTTGTEIVVLQQEFVNGIRTRLIGLFPSAALKWDYQVDGTKIQPSGFSCCSSSRPVTVNSLKTGGSLFLTNEIRDGNGFNLLIVRINNEGKLM